MLNKLSTVGWIYSYDRVSSITLFNISIKIQFGPNDRDYPIPALNRESVTSSSGDKCYSSEIHNKTKKIVLIFFSDPPNASSLNE